ncbi:MAG: tetratricopeptide repeat protein, partial [Pseudomonadota bacterium]
LGLLQVSLGRTGEAEARLNQVLASDARSAAALAGLGNIARDRKDFETAADLYRRALVIDPAASQVNYRLGLVYRALGDLDAARTVLAQRGERIPRIRDPLLNVMQAHVHPASHYMAQADTAISRNDLRGGAQQLALALAVEPEHEQALVTLGEVLLAARRDDAAKQQFQKLVDAHPDNALGPYYLGLCALRGGDRATAARLMRESLKIDPDLARAKTALARLGGG